MRLPGMRLPGMVMVMVVVMAAMAAEDEGAAQEHGRSIVRIVWVVAVVRIIGIAVWRGVGACRRRDRRLSRHDRQADDSPAAVRLRTDPADSLMLLSAYPHRLREFAAPAGVGSRVAKSGVGVATRRFGALCLSAFRRRGSRRIRAIGFPGDLRRGLRLRRIGARAERENETDCGKTGGGHNHVPTTEADSGRWTAGGVPTGPDMETSGA